MKRFIYGLLALSLLMLSGCSINEDSSSNDSSPLPQVDAGEDNSSSIVETESKAEKLLHSMTLEEKIGQLFIIRPDDLELNLTSEQINDSTNNGAVELDTNMQETLKKYPIGGVSLFGKNILNPTQLTTFISDMQKQSTIPLFVSIDEEGGTVSRIAKSPNFDVPKFESMQKIGETKNVAKAKDVGFTIGSYLKSYGVNLDFAPVADINTNPKNIVIGNRSFGNDPDLVSKMVFAEISGLHEAGIMSCVKHFPGHGDTKGDTHTGEVSIEKTWEELKKCELVPFINSIDTTDMVMISHITIPNITSDGIPASLSNEIIEGKLRKELGYKGVVISDAMEMGAITKKYSSEESAVKAVLAGVDIILMPESFVESYNGIYDAVKNGVINETRIDDSVLRILNLKESYHL
ncbi:glycoside hydrolase family 3 protein [Clostridium algidicarnis]|uniref:glycoside hydrolase family 3 protein n=1 Tax=Clostridium algidicarnis TaxID=37659 RepID=UPI001C0E7815|nr:glycoside hydrolase family 3 protein [Clostridium algidicarnis]MBU3202786.1 glycoside hydrolase family 3 protein [Clostridium algidicarnis]MBU3210940.1 glycoside hydrolase family 3 protein [Clostridium algidicarnis]MBU3222552.1 glycoside hydrolase family 3 protein [Clostridium algidicarnis]